MEVTEFVTTEKLSPFVGARFALIRWSSGRFLALLSAGQESQLSTWAFRRKATGPSARTSKRMHAEGVPELVTAIGEDIAYHNTEPKPFIWTKNAGEMLLKVIRADSRLGSKPNATLH